MPNPAAKIVPGGEQAAESNVKDFAGFGSSYSRLSDAAAGMENPSVLVKRVIFLHHNEAMNRATPRAGGNLGGRKESVCRWLRVGGA